MDKIRVRSKVAWVVDLTESVEVSWSKSVVKKIRQDDCARVVNWEWKDGPSVRKLFSPMYETRLMQRADYRLDKELTRSKLMGISRDSEYQLLWFTDSRSGKGLGGIIIHFMEEEARVAYRVFDHEAARDLEVKSLDYYAELVLRKQLITKGFDIFYHGSDMQPIMQMGLSQFKMSIGARPVEPASEVKSAVFTRDKIRDYVDQNGIFGYYGKPVNGRYQSLFTWCRDNHKIDMGGLRKLVSRIGVSMEIMTI